MTDPEHDEAFETYLKRRPVLPKALDEGLEPPAALDYIVLEKAREAIQTQAAAGQGKLPTARAPRWAVPVALAATLLLCLSVVLNVSLNTNRPTANLQGMTAAGDIQSHEAVLAEKKVVGSPASAASAPSAAPARAVAPAPGAASARAVAPAPDAASAGAVAPAPDAAREAPPAYGESMPPPATEVPRVASTSAADKAATLTRRAFASTSGTVPSIPAPGPLAGVRQSDTQEQSDVTSGAARADAAGPHPADPKLWLQQIDALRAVGKIDQANAEMHRFRAAFPDYAAKPAPPASSEPPK